MIRCTSFRPFRKNTLQGFCDFELTRIGIVLHDCTWHRHANGKEWIGFPARRYEDPNGNTLWQPIVEFTPGAKRARELFQQQALEAIHATAAEDDQPQQ